MRFRLTSDDDAAGQPVVGGVDVVHRVSLSLRSPGSVVRAVVRAGDGVKLGADETTDCV